MASIRTVGRSSWRCPSCSGLARHHQSFSTSSTARALGPESPRYLDIPETAQTQKHRKQIVKGALPVPRDIFSRIKGGTKRVTDSYLDAATQDARQPVGSSTLAQAQHNEHQAKMAELRKRNLREGLTALKQRREKMQALSRERTARQEAERKKLLSREPREDERLTAPSITELLRDNKIDGRLPDPNREQRLADKATRLEAKNAAKARDRQDALHTLYMHAREFIVTEKQLDHAIDETFGTQEQPKTWAGQGLSIWADGPPPTISAMLARASGAKGARAGDTDFRARATKDRLGAQDRFTCSGPYFHVKAASPLVPCPFHFHSSSNLQRPHFPLTCFIPTNNYWVGKAVPTASLGLARLSKLGLVEHLLLGTVAREMHKPHASEQASKDPPSLDVVHRIIHGEDDGTKPSLSLIQLMVAAVASNPKGRCTISSVNHWICSHFRWYKELHQECKPRDSWPEYYDYTHVCACEYKLAQELSNQTDRQHLYGLLSPFKFHREDKTISLVPGAVEQTIYPEDIKDPEFFRYESLPTEIRLEILRHTFTFNLDKHGWRLTEKSWWSSRQRHFEAMVDGRRVSNIKPKHLLSPLLVNKQMYQESAPLFFKVSNFHFDNCHLMVAFLNGIGIKHRGWLTSVSLDYMMPGDTTGDRSAAHRAFRLLAESNKLMKIRIRMDETYINKKGMPQEAHSFPGFQILRKLRGLRSVVFEGTYAKAEAYIKSDLLKPCVERTGELVRSRAQIAEDKRKARERAILNWKKSVEKAKLQREVKELLEENDERESRNSPRYHAHDLSRTNRFNSLGQSIIDAMQSDDEDYSEWDADGCSDEDAWISALSDLDSLDEDA
ncbi:hypothetical protein FH972_021229 [Carpinus fangiana]|uniref:Fork-head domain-containing protein n=1 Tax=Carpinus fangiana TaxID=176857 RepID=A0A5N6KNX7_9ROSI|nr:hypothetical protein FH972_021229 [Carpinus fangiana]